MRIFKIIIWVVMGLVLVAVAAVAALIFVDPNAYRNQIETRASAAFDREFKIAGPIHLERSLRPRIIVEDISIGNPDWATDTHFATAEKVGIQVALFALLRGNLRVLDVSFSGVDLFIEEGPDGANNYTFGNGDESETTGFLPAVERLRVNDSVINYKTADGSSKHLKISAAQLWNIPGEPERIEAKGSTKEMTFNIRLVADSAAELSGPQNPWSLKLDIEGPDMSLTLAGRMDEAFKWERGDYLIKLSGDKADSLETLFDVELPTSGPFEISANVNKTNRSLRVTDIAARLQGAPQTRAIIISDGEAAGGQDDPLQLALQGQFGEAPFTLRFKSTQPLEDISQKTPWPVEAQLNLADLKLNIESEIIPATVTEHLEFNAQLQGETLNTLSRLLETDLPEAGPYQLSFHTNIASGSYTLTNLEGHVEGTDLWKKIRIMGGEAFASESGTVKASIDAKLDTVPLSLSVKGGPEAAGKAGATIWPLNLQASASEATLTGEGSGVTTKGRKVLKMATRIEGNRLESLGPLIGASLPTIGKFNLSADVNSDGNVHEAGNLKIQMGSNRLTGNLRWEDKAPRPVLSGKLSSDSLRLGMLLGTSSNPSPKTGSNGLLDRPIKLDGLKKLDAQLDLTVKDVTDSPIPVADIKSTVMLANGELNARFRGKAVGAPVDGQIMISQRKNIPAISLKTKFGQIDVGQTLKQLKVSDIVVGTAEAIKLNGSSQGETLRTLLEQASINLRIKPANLSYTNQIVARTINFTFDSVEFFTEKDLPVTAIFSGKLQKIPFNATVSATNLAELLRADAKLPLHVTLQRPDEQFNAEITVSRPFENIEFDLNHELIGKEIEGLSPLLDFAVPLQGEFHASGLLKARGNKFTYEEDLRVGKSDIKLSLTVLRSPTSPKITGSIFAKDLHMDNMRLFPVDEGSGNGASEDRSRVIPDYTIPTDALLTADLDFDIQAKRIRSGSKDLGELVAKVRLKDGWFKSTFSINGFMGSRISGGYDLNAAVKPPLTKFQLNAKDLNYGHLFKSMGLADLLEGGADLYLDLSGSGATRYSFFENAEGRITVIAGPGKISGRRIDLWAADLIPTMLSTRWRRENVTATNCLVAHIKLGEGLAKIEDLLLDTQRIRIAASGIVNLETEELDLIVAPRPKRASLVSLANPVRIRGTLAEPEVSVTRIPRGRRLAAVGLLAGLVNPAFLILALSDTGTGSANPCDTAVEHAREVSGVDSE
jgi:uncharacterized protein involved in outer membrane biogenesis